MIKVSIIVPVYNGEVYLDRCIKSLINQTYNDIEIILIDDGSTDKSSYICKKWGKKDNRIRVLGQENVGVTASRNRGITEADGDLITFVDSDDWIEPRFVENAVSIFDHNNETDIVILGMINDYYDGSTQRVGKIGIDYQFDNTEAVDEMFRHEYFRWELCGKVYRKELFDGFRGDEKLIVCEDLDSNWILFHRAKKIYYSCCSSYHYFVNESSVTRNFDYSRDTTLDVFKRILSSDYKISFSIKMWILRSSINIIVRDVREMLFKDPQLFKNRINRLVKELLLLTDQFPDSSLAYSDLLDVFKKKEKPRNQIFFKEFQRLKEIASKVMDYEKIYIYGTGAAGRYLLLSIPKEAVHKVCFVVSDSKYNRNIYCGCVVLKASELSSDIKSVVVVTIQNRSKTDVISDLRDRGIGEVIELNVDYNIYVPA